MGDTQIDDLLNDINNTKVSAKEDTIVDSIIKELNSDSNPSKMMNTQANMPQITPEEKELLMKQQYMEQQKMMQQQQQQQHQRMMQQRMMQQQNNVANNMANVANNSESDFQKYFKKFKDTLVVLFLSFLFNFDNINEVLMFKNVPFLFNSEINKPTIVAVIIKSVLIAIIFFLIQTFMK